MNMTQSIIVVFADFSLHAIVVVSLLLETFSITWMNKLGDVK